MRSIYLFISRNRRKWIFRILNRVVYFLYYALENKNNDHATNGEFWLMKRLSKERANIVFDVGANIGKWSLEARKTFGQASIYSFEPMPEVFIRLQDNIAGKPDIQVFNLALSNEKGTLDFNYYPNEILFSSIYAHYKGGESKQVKVQCIDGDNFCRENNIQEIDFLKIDAEGSEHLILTGFDNMLRTQKIKAIQFEYGVLSIDSKFLLSDYYKFFSRYNYRVGKIYPNYVSFTAYDWKLENFIGPNYLAIRNTEIELIRSLK